MLSIINTTKKESFSAVRNMHGFGQVVRSRQGNLLKALQRGSLPKLMRFSNRTLN